MANLLAAKTEAELSDRVTALKLANNGQAPILATILVGCRPCLWNLCKDETKCL